MALQASDKLVLPAVVAVPDFRAPRVRQEIQERKDSQDRLDRKVGLEKLLIGWVSFMVIYTMQQDFYNLPYIKFNR